MHLSALSCGLIYSTCLNPALVHPRLLRIWKEKLLIPTTFQTGGRSLDQGRHGYVMLAEKGVATEKNVNIALQRNTGAVLFRSLNVTAVGNGLFTQLKGPTNWVNLTCKNRQSIIKHQGTMSMTRHWDHAWNWFFAPLHSRLLYSYGIFAHVFRLFGWWTLPISGAEAMQDHCRKGFEELRGETQGAPSWNMENDWDLGKN